MKKRFLLLMLIFSILCIAGGDFSQLKAQNDPNVVTIGNGDKTNYNIPFDIYYKYAFCQQLFTNTEIGKTGKITSISLRFYGETNNPDSGNGATNDPNNKTFTRNIAIYLTNVDAESLVDQTGIDLDENAIPNFEGDVTLSPQSWVDFNVEFTLEEEKNLLVTIADNTGETAGSKYYYWYCDAVGNSALSRGRSDYGKYDILGAGKINDLNPNLQPNRSQIKLTFANDSQTSELKAPTNLEESDITDKTATITWEYGDNNTATDYKIYIGTEENNLLSVKDEWTERGYSGTELNLTGTYPFEGLDPNTKYYYKVEVKDANDANDATESAVGSFTTSYGFEKSGDWNDPSNWQGGMPTGQDVNVTINAAATITAEDIITVKDLTISEGASLTINGSLTITGEFANTDASKLVINDGGQIFQTNEGVKATFNMKIINPEGEWNENNKTGWQFISSPFTDAYISDFVTTGDGNDYDLYKFDGKQVGAEWVNHKQTQEEIDNEIPNDFETTFQQGRGYLASYEDAETATLNGTLNTSTILNLAEGQLSYEGGTLADLYLIGNPFPFDMDMSKLNGWTDDITEGYAVVNNGSYSYYNLGGTIPAGDGFFVKAEGSNAALYYNHNAKSSRSGNANSLNITATGNTGKDNVVVNFNGEGEGFPKLQNFNDDIATVYVQDNNVNYGIYNCDKNTTEVELCFNANQMGNYTISIEPNGKFQTVTLVDRFTGIETNLLVDDYHFTAMSEENNNRFILKLAVSDQQSAVSDNFVYQSGEELIIDAEGTVQIIDMMGRVVYTSNVENNNRINVSNFNNGAYVVRVINESEIKVEKIIL